MKLETLNDLYVEELRDLYSVENQILKALPDMVKAAHSPDLKVGFESHLRQTQEHVSRLERIFDKMGQNPRGKFCKGMEGILEEGKDLLKEKAEPDVLDAGLITAAQHVEHYEIAGYGTVRTYAKLLGQNEAATLLQQTLNEEEQTDQKLTQLSTRINVEAR
ncbi:MAG: ferritin-like protein [Chthonomonadaceae bacterium]|nr:ferritin-like protein [Chthonomonadaceae bacterium]